MSLKQMQYYDNLDEYGLKYEWITNRKSWYYNDMRMVKM